MSWRDDLRPGSYRGVPFDCRGSGERGGIRGAHHIYPGRDQGWIEQLGREDRRISLDAYVIGDDYMARRDALRDALNEPGAGELIHPWLGSLNVTLDPGAGWSISENFSRGRTARFSLSFIIAPADGTLPAESVDGAAATSTAADAVEASALSEFAAALDLSGIEALATDFEAAMTGVLEDIDQVTAIVRRAAELPGQIAALAIAPIGEIQSRAADLIGLRDGLGSLGLLFDAVAGNVGGRLRGSTEAGLPGARPTAVPPDASTNDPALAASAAAAATALLDRARPGSGVPRFAANRDVLDEAMDLALLSELARATTRRGFGSHGEAITAMKDLDRRIEGAILKEPGDELVAGLTDLRAASRTALLAAAANTVPIATVAIGESLPVLAASWRVTAGISAAPDLIGRNAIQHPLWAPAEIQAQLGEAAQ